MLYKIGLLIFGALFACSLFAPIQAMHWLNYSRGRYRLYWDGTRATIPMSWISMYVLVFLAICFFVFVVTGIGILQTGAVLVLLILCWFYDKKRSRNNL
jgi:hypothetical protein